MKKDNIIIILLLFAFSLLLLPSCQSFLEDSVQNKLNLPTYIKTDAEAAKFFYGGINLVSTATFGIDYLSPMESPTDQTYFISNDNSRLTLSSMTYDISNQNIKNLWGDLYKVIGQMNILIDRLETGVLKDSGYSPRIMAQAKFVRAWCYFQLVQLWGQVPITRAYYSTSGDITPARSSVSDVYALIEGDLTYGLSENRLRDFGVTSAGVKVMPDTVVFKFPYDAASAATMYFLPVSKGAAQLLLAKVYLAQGGHDADAEPLVDAMIAKQGTLYNLLPNYGDLFDVDKKATPYRCQEVLWEIEAQAVAGQFNSTHRQVAPDSYNGIKATANAPHNTVVGKSSGGYKFYIPTEYFLSQFDQLKDKRYFWMYQFCKPNSNIPTWAPAIRKGFDITTSNSDYGGCNAVLLRYADVLLIKAELRAKAGDLTSAKTFLDKIRSRAGLAPYDLTGKTKDQVFADVIQERSFEFAHEAGNRLFDLRRTGTFESALQAFNAWYDTNVTHNPKSPQTITIINPACQGTPDPGDQSVNGDYFEIPVPFVPGTLKIYSTKCLLHPIPQYELMQNGNLQNNLNYPGWN